MFSHGDTKNRPTMKLSVIAVELPIRTRPSVILIFMVVLSQDCNALHPGKSFSGSELNCEGKAKCLSYLRYISDFIVIYEKSAHEVLQQLNFLYFMFMLW